MRTFPGASVTRTPPPGPLGKAMPSGPAGPFPSLGSTGKPSAKVERRKFASIAAWVSVKSALDGPAAQRTIATARTIRYLDDIVQLLRCVISPNFADGPLTAPGDHPKPS